MDPIPSGLWSNLRSQWGDHGFWLHNPFPSNISSSPFSSLFFFNVLITIWKTISLFMLPFVLSFLILEYKCHMGCDFSLSFTAVPQGLTESQVCCGLCAYLLNVYWLTDWGTGYDSNVLFSFMLLYFFQRAFMYIILLNLPPTWGADREGRLAWWCELFGSPSL